MCEHVTGFPVEGTGSGMLLMLLQSLFEVAALTIKKHVLVT